MFRFVALVFAFSAVATATHFEYLDNGIEYDVSPNMIEPLPYAYLDGYRGHSVNLKPSTSYVTLVEPEVPKTELVLSQSSLLSSIASHAVACASWAVSFLTNNFSALVLGTTAALGVCKLTSLCSQGEETLLLLQREIRSLATPQRLKRATEFVESAIRKYNDMQ